MRIETLELKDYRRFEDLRVDFQFDAGGMGGLTALVAKNGEGKSSVLDAINVAFGTFIGAMPNAIGASLRESDIRTEYVDEKVVRRGFPRVSATFSGTGIGEPATVSRELSLSNKRASTTTKDARALTDYAKRLLIEPDNEAIWPLLAYYGDNRLWAGERLTEQRIRNALSAGREYGYVDSTNPKSGYREFSLWFPALEFALFAEESRRSRNDVGFNERNLERFQAQLDPIKAAIKKSLEPAGWGDVFSDIDRGIWAFNADRSAKVLIESLSAGVKIVIGLVGDVAFRCAKLNAHLKGEALAGTPGIVLIDEIELHLHPGWQQVILPTLREIFPRIQFIVTTHSPQVVSSIPSECVRIIRDGETIMPSFQTQGVECQEALFEVFETEAAPPNDPSVKKLRRLDELERNGFADADEYRELYDELKDHYGFPYPPLESIEIRRRYGKKGTESERNNARVR